MFFLQNAGKCRQSVLTAAAANSFHCQNHTTNAPCATVCTFGELTVYFARDYPNCKIKTTMLRTAKAQCAQKCVKLRREVRKVA